MKLLEAKKVEQPDAESIVAIKYEDGNSMRCTMFVRAGNDVAVDALVDLVNRTVKDLAMS